VNKWRRIHVLIDEDDHKALIKLGSHQGAISHLVRLAIREFLTNIRKKIAKVKGGKDAERG